jgi:hypothetical protein
MGTDIVVSRVTNICWLVFGITSNGMAALSWPLEA